MICKSVCKSLWLAVLSAGLVACAAAPQVTRMDAPSPSDAGPYEKVLVVSLFESFDMRRYLERELVAQLSALGTEAVASTSMMNSQTPVVPQTFIDMVKEIGADSVLVTQLTDLESKAKEVNTRPEATYKVEATYYYNVFSVEHTEYTEPPEIRMEHDVTLLAELISVQTREPVWAIQTHSKIVLKSEMERDYSAYVDEAKTITRQLVKDDLIE